ncbi:MAG TPA: LLM class F420-dependent oxidoreductase [Acidimicrobiales bacterium]
MRIGLHLSASGRTPNSIDELVAEAAAVEAAGLDAMWMPQLFDVDALTALAVIGREVDRIELGTSVVPTYPRHPLMLAGQALTTQAATGNRLTLGIGLSHQMVIEGVFGYSFEQPARHMAEYLSILMPALAGEAVAFQGATLKATAGPLTVAGARTPDVLVAALGPVMLKLAGRLADGTATWMVGPKTLGDHIVPVITQAAAAAGRRPPRVAVGLPVCVTSDPDGTRVRASKTFAMYGQLPSYRAMLDREGVTDPADVAIIGDEEAVAGRLRRLIDLGATELTLPVIGARPDRSRTVALLSELAGKG